MTDAELLALRSDALNRIAKQLDAVRELHRQHPKVPWWCERCNEAYPCETARAAGVTT